MWINLNIFERHYKILHKCKPFDLAREGARYKQILNFREKFFSATYPWYLLNYSLVATLDTTFDNSNFYTNNNCTSPTNNTSSIYSDTFTGYESNRTFIYIVLFNSNFFSRLLLGKIHAVTVDGGTRNKNKKLPSP